MLNIIKDVDFNFQINDIKYIYADNICGEISGNNIFFQNKSFNFEYSDKWLLKSSLELSGKIKLLVIDNNGNMDLRIVDLSVLSDSDLSVDKLNHVNDEANVENIQQDKPIYNDGGEFSTTKTEFPDEASTYEPNELIASTNEEILSDNLIEPLNKEPLNDKLNEPSNDNQQNSSSIFSSSGSLGLDFGSLFDNLNKNASSSENVQVENVKVENIKSENIASENVKVGKKWYDSGSNLCDSENIADDNNIAANINDFSSENTVFDDRKLHLGESNFEVVLNDNAGIVIFGGDIENEARIVLEADGHAACDKRELVLRNPFVKIDNIVANLQFDKWIISFSWQIEENAERKIPVIIKNMNGGETNADFVIPGGYLEITDVSEDGDDQSYSSNGFLFEDDENSGRIIRSENNDFETDENIDDDSEKISAMAYFTFEMKHGFVEIGETVIKLDKQALIIKEGEIASKDFILSNIRCEFDNDKSWTIYYDFDKGFGDKCCIPVKFIDEYGGVFAQIIMGENNAPMLVEESSEKLPNRSYGKFNMFYGESNVVFTIGGHIGNPLGDGARFVLQEGTLLIYHMGSGWYLYEFELSDEWIGKNFEKIIHLKGEDIDGDEAEINIRIEFASLEQ